MFLFLPFRAKNIPERVPYITWSLIAINTIIFALTSNHLWTIRPEIMEQFAVTHTHFTLGRILTAIFLHSNFGHLAGNMVFLYLFGTCVEGRLGYIKYLFVYLLCGYSGSLLHDAIMGWLAPEVPSLGASGAIMGLAGAYLFLFPYATISVLFMYAFSFFYRARFDVTILEWPAWGVIAYYLGFDVLNAVLFQGRDGVGHFAHIGGAIAGYLAVLALRAQRDTVEFSEAQEMRFDLNDNYDAMGLEQLDLLMSSPGVKPEMILAYVRNSVNNYSGNTDFTARAVGALHRHVALLLEKADPVLLAQCLLTIPETAPALPPLLLIRLPSLLERSQNYGLAIPLLQRLYRQNPTGPDAETALLRLARISERNDNKTFAIAQYQEILRLFPGGRNRLEIQDTLRRLGAPQSPPRPAAHPDNRLR